MNLFSTCFDLFLGNGHTMLKTPILRPFCRRESRKNKLSGVRRSRAPPPRPLRRPPCLGPWENCSIFSHARRSSSSVQAAASSASSSPSSAGSVIHRHRQLPHESENNPRNHETSNSNFLARAICLSIRGSALWRSGPGRSPPTRGRGLGGPRLDSLLWICRDFLNQGTKKHAVRF